MIIILSLTVFYIYKLNGFLQWQVWSRVNPHARVQRMMHQHSIHQINYVLYHFRDHTSVLRTNAHTSNSKSGHGSHQ